MTHQIGSQPDPECQSPTKQMTKLLKEIELFKSKGQRGTVIN